MRPSIPYRSCTPARISSDALPSQRRRLRFSDFDDQDPCLGTEMDDVGGRGPRDWFRGGLDLCTESLGSESCNGRLDPEEEEALLEGTAWAAEKAEHDEPRRRIREPRRTTGFPQPLRWMSDADGRRAGIIRAERRDGRLVLTDVRIERPQVLRAAREAGRLRLHAVESDGDEEALREKVENEGERGENGERPERPRGGGEGFTRCQDIVNSKHVEVPVWWNHRFVSMA